MLERNQQNISMIQGALTSGVLDLVFEEPLSSGVCNFVFFRFFFDMEPDLIYIPTFTYTLCVYLLLDNNDHH